MKRMLTFIIVTALAVAAYPMYALATVAGTAHDYKGVSTRGQCEVCHVPHAASASTKARLWRASRDMSGYAEQASNPDWDHSVVGQLCGMCHGTAGGGVGWARATNVDSEVPHDTSATVYSTDSHRREIARLTGGTHAATPGCNDTPANVSARPYMTATIQCTSCHNVHIDGVSGSADETAGGVRPFLRANGLGSATISAVCGDCHDRYNTMLGTQNAGPNTAGNKRSMHPVDIGYQDDGGSGHGTNDSYGSVGAGGATQFKDSLSVMNGTAAAKTWSLDIPGRFQTAANKPVIGTYNASHGATYAVGCQTCHAIHNPAATADGNVAKKLYLLAVDNTPNVTEGSMGAALCESCHGGGDGSATQLVGATVGQVDTGGNAMDDHPIDMKPDGTPKLENWNATVRWERYISTSDTVWPHGVGSGGGFYVPASNNSNIAGNLGRIVCTSCHSAHNGVTLTPMKRSNGDATEWCYSCHKSEDTVPSNHHSTRSIGGTGPGNWTADGTTGLSKIYCENCHGNAGSGNKLNAHMGFFILTDGSGNGISNANSQLCLNCHAGGDVAVDPVEVNTGSWGGSGNIPNGHLSGTGSGYQTHYIGLFNNRVAGSYINVKTGYWNPSVNGRGASYSKYGGGTDNHNMHKYGSAGYPFPSSPQVICESCHSVLMNTGDIVPAATSKNGLYGGWMVNLLLQNYEDNTVGDTAGGVSNTGKTTGGSYQQTGVGSGFCVACHNQNHDADGTGTSDGLVAHSIVNGPGAATPGSGTTIVPANMHPMTGWTITRAVDAGETGANRYLNTGATRYAAVGPGQGSYDGSNAMSCDGCHRPHLADPNGKWSITSYTPAVSGKRSVILENTGITGDNDYGPFCRTCHAM